MHVHVCVVPRINSSWLAKHGRRIANYMCIRPPYIAIEARQHCAIYICIECGCSFFFTTLRHFVIAAICHAMAMVRTRMGNSCYSPGTEYMLKGPAERDEKNWLLA